MDVIGEYSYEASGDEAIESQRFHHLQRYNTRRSGIDSTNLLPMAPEPSH